MKQTEILAKIAAIKEAVDTSNPDLIRRLIAEDNQFHIQASHRRSLIGRLTNKLRQKLLFEVERGLEPILSRQREINLRLLKEIEAIKAALPLKEDDPLN